MADKTKKNYHSGHRERMRARFDADAEMLTFQDHEMLEFILNCVIPRKDTNDIAHELIAQNGSLYGVFNSSPMDLLRAKNMTVSASYLLSSIIPIVRKALRMSNENNMLKVINYGDAADFFHTFFMARNTECLCVLFMGVRYKLLKTMVVNDLNPTSVAFNARNIAAAALKAGAKFVMIGHNHPSGSAFPSEDDFMLIWHLFNVLAGLDIELLDNFIFTETGFLSFRNVGILHKFLNEYNLRNPARTLREDNKRVSLYISNLSQYLINVTKLNQEAMVELITIDEFIKRNRPKINDVRAEKEDFEKDSSREPLTIEKVNYNFANDDPGDPLMDRGNEELIMIADQLQNGEIGEYDRKKLHTFDINSLVDEAEIEMLDKASGNKKNEKRPAKVFGPGFLRKIHASSRNIPEIVDIPDDYGDEE